MTAQEGVPRYKQWAREAIKHPWDVVRSVYVRGASEKGIIALVMQNVNNSITVAGERTRSGRFRLRSRQGEGAPNPSWIPVANDAMRRLAKIIGGSPRGNWGEVVDAPMTAHFIGGAVIGLTADEGVIDPYHRVHGYPGLHIADGSTITANVGVNPSLTITAMAERAMSLWPNAGEEDPRPEQGAGYRRVSPRCSPRTRSSRTMRPVPCVCRSTSASPGAARMYAGVDTTDRAAIRPVTVPA